METVTLTLDRLSALLVHGPLFFWAAFALASLLGPLLAWLLARSGSGRRAAAARDRIGGPTGGLRAAAEGEVSVLSGMLELEDSGALVSDARDGLASAAGRGSGETAAFLRVGDARVALEGRLHLLAGSRERWGVSPRRPATAGAAADDDESQHHPSGLRMSAHRRWLASGQPARARGVLRIQPGDAQHSYRHAELRHVLGPPSETGHIELAAERRPHVRLSARLAIWTLVLAAAAFTGASQVVGIVAYSKAQDHYEDIGSSGPDAVERAMRWGTLGAAVPLHRERSLDIIERALDRSLLDDPPARETVLLAASFERFRTGTCADTLAETAGDFPRLLAAQLGETCADPASLRAASWARLELGELDRAADLAARAAALDPRRTVEQVALERTAYLMAGRLAPAAAALREMQSRVAEFYEPPEGAPERAVADWSSSLRGELGCAADQLLARAGDAAARMRLQAARDNPSAAPAVRSTCALLLADLAGGAERLAIIDRIRNDRGIEDVAELATLELEADPSRAPSLSPIDFHLNVGTPAHILAGRSLMMQVSALEWSALERLAATSELPLPARIRRAHLAVELAPVASLLGDDGRARRWTDMVMRDWEILGAHPAARFTATMRAWTADQLSALRTYVEIRSGGAPELPRRRAAAVTAEPTPFDDDWRELEGVLDFIERGDLGKLRQLGSSTFGPGAGNDVFAGLEIAARGSGEELARWLDERFRVPMTAMTVALVGARRTATGRPALRAWLSRAPASPLDRSFTDLAIHVANRQRIADALGDGQAAAEYRAAADGIRRGLLRRETAAVREVLGIH